MQSVQIRRLLLSALVFSFVDGEFIYTPNKYEYKTVEEVKGKGHVVFDVESCNDAHIALMSTPSDKDRLYEIVIGGWFNTLSCLRECRQCACLEKYSGRLLNCFNYKSFWVKWKQSQGKLLIRVGRGRNVGLDTFMEYYDYSPIPISYIGISSGFGAVGTWDMNPREKIYTPNGYKYQVVGSLAGKTWTTITVRACSDAHVALMSEQHDYGRLYEIVIGGWLNTQSCIRRCKQCTCQMSHAETVLDCNSYRKFWIDWSGNVVKVGKGSVPHMYTMLEFHEPNPFTIRYLGISTGWGSTGSWVLTRITKKDQVSSVRK